MTQYRRGVRAEYRARDDLLREGYHTVFRAAGSHGPADLIAVGDKHVKFVQVKSSVLAKPPSFAAELKALRDWPVPDGNMKELRIWLRNKRAWVVMPA